ncbi:site-specific integrase [Nonomuraea typhae]|uniref:site-specific integrase n=1 Tax=Nonomuraea typhae TaxID=2603600 RepID=UPI0012FB6BA5|nr:site-specific integrase [Nonomuraea typhae]
MSGFLTEKAADKYWQDMESDVRNNRYVDPKAGMILFEEYANLWYASLDLEPTTMTNYRYYLEHHILPFFSGRSLAAIAQSREEIDGWERDLMRVDGYAARTARDARVTLATCLGAAIPHRIQFNPAVKEKARGRRGLRRVEQIRAQQKTKDVLTPLEVVLFGERVAALTGQDDDLVRELLYAFSAVRWGEALALGPRYLTEDGRLNIEEKLYELSGHFYRGIPKDGSIRKIDLPPLLLGLLAELKPRRCTCKKRLPRPGDPAWCQGGEYLFLGPYNGHPRRSNFGRAAIRPAADGWFPEEGGKNPRPRMPVMVDLSQGWPGVPVVPWPAVEDGLPWVPPRLAERSRGRKTLPADTPLAVWLPFRKIEEESKGTKVSTHLLRHTASTWNAEDRIPDIMRDERMGHRSADEGRAQAEMRDHYTHATELMRADVVQTLQQRLETALMQRAELERLWAEEGIPRRSTVPLMNKLLEPFRAATLTSVSTPLIPRLGGRRSLRRASGRASNAG